MAMEEELILSAEDVLVNMDEPYMEIYFSDRVHDFIDKTMVNAVIVRLLSRAIGYKTSMNCLTLLWQLEGSIQVVDQDNNYYVVKFSCVKDYTKSLFESH